MLRNLPFTLGVVGVRHVIRRRQLPLGLLVQHERQVFGVVVAVRGQHIEDHSAKAFFARRIG